MAKSKFPILFVVGPTACGKSAWAHGEAKKNNGIICNADSVQIYRQLNIGAAKPKQSEMNEVRHELFDLVDLDQDFTAGEYRRRALAVIEREIESHPLYFVGGSGFYIQALEKGMFEVQKNTPEQTQQIDAWEEAGVLFTKLNELDPAYAAKISANDFYRQRRALEICLAEGRCLTEVRADFDSEPNKLSDRFDVKKIGFQVARDQLRERVTLRTMQMLKDGLVNEVKSILSMGFGGCRPLRSVGYAETLDYIEGRLPYEQLPSEIVTSTMQLAKRQLTSFKRDSAIDWKNPVLDS